MLKCCFFFDTVRYRWSQFFCWFVTVRILDLSMPLLLLTQWQYSICICHIWITLINAINNAECVNAAVIGYLLVSGTQLNKQQLAIAI